MPSSSNNANFPTFFNPTKSYRPSLAQQEDLNLLQIVCQKVSYLYSQCLLVGTAKETTKNSFADESPTRPKFGLGVNILDIDRIGKAIDEEYQPKRLKEEDQKKIRLAVPMVVVPIVVVY